MENADDESFRCVSYPRRYMSRIVLSKMAFITNSDAAMCFWGAIEPWNVRKMTLSQPGELASDVQGGSVLC